MKQNEVVDVLLSKLQEADKTTLAGTNHIVAVAILYENPRDMELPHKAVLAKKLVEEYKRTGLIPRDLRVTPQTPVAMRQLIQGKEISADAGLTTSGSNLILSEMFSGLGLEEDFSQLSGTAYLGNSVALGQTFFAVLASRRGSAQVADIVSESPPATKQQPQYDINAHACWFCKGSSGASGSNLGVDLRKDLSRAGNRIQYVTATVSIPCCSDCLKAYKSEGVKNFFVGASFLGGTGGIYYLLYSSLPLEKTGIVITISSLCGILAGIVFAALFISLLNKAFPSMKYVANKPIHSYPELKRRFEEGWSRG